jgi:hypothetical protein
MLLNNGNMAKMAKSAASFSKSLAPYNCNISVTVLARSVQSTQTRTKATLPDLPYDYSALEPVISAEIMQLHHSKHHQTYVNMYNVAADKLAEAVEKGIEKDLLEF